MSVYVTGMGIVSALGVGRKDTLNSLRRETSGIKYSDEFKKLIAQVGLSDAEMTESLEMTSTDHSRATLLAAIAAREAWNNNSHSDKLRTGFIGGTSVGGLDKTEEYFFRYRAGDTAALRLMLHDNGRIADTIAAWLGINDYINMLATACSSGSNAIMHAARMIESQRLDRALAGGTDQICRYSIEGFSSLMIYDDDECKPFDENRNGLNLGEGAAFLLLEGEKSLETTGNTVLCELIGWSNASDAFHQTATSDKATGATLAMKQALSHAGIKQADIDYLNAHGTGTSNNDLTESHAILNVFDQQLPLFSSTKGYTGHTLAAAGAIEAVISIESLVNGLIFPNLNFSSPIQETGLIPLRKMRDNEEMHYVMTNSFGFGGNCNSLIFKK